jgi:hypothetical protein
MTVMPDMGGAARGVENMYAVASGSGSTYVVDLEKRACECPDSMHNLRDGEACKHVRRAEFATGTRPVPVDAAMECERDGSFGAHVAGEVEVEEVEKPTP